MKNRVIAGEYKNWDVLFSFNKMYVMSGLKKEEIKKTSVCSWSVVDDVAKNPVWKPLIGSSVGGMLFGPFGAMTGAAIGSRNASHTYFVSVEYYSGDKSLLQLDAKGYQNLVQCLY